MLSCRGSKLKAFAKMAGGRLTTASPLVLYGLRLSAFVVLAMMPRIKNGALVDRSRN
jgi:hypothetical protein